LKYSIDTSALLDGWRRYYSPDVFPAVWSGIEELIDVGDLAATEEVLVELEKRDDEIHAWAKERKDKLVVPIDERIQERVAEILDRHERLVRNSRSGADPWVIGLAMVEGCTVVSAERPAGSLAKPRIPDVCLDLGVPCIDLLGLFRELRWRFVRS
jgi:hypothetical protein